MNLFGLCKGRHELPTNNYIFDTIEDVKNLDGMREIVHAKLKNIEELGVYVTGLTIALTTVINYCMINLVPLTLFHYDRDSGEYYEQVMDTTEWRHSLEEAGYI